VNANGFPMIAAAFLLGLGMHLPLAACDSAASREADDLIASITDDRLAPDERLAKVRKAAEICPNWWTHFNHGLEALEQSERPINPELALVARRSFEKAIQTIEGIGSPEWGMVKGFLARAIDLSDGLGCASLEYQHAVDTMRARQGDIDAAGLRPQFDRIMQWRTARTLSSGDISCTLDARNVRLSHKSGFGVEEVNSIEVYVRFAPGSAALDASGRKQAEEMGEALMGYYKSTGRISVIGHTDSVGPDQENDALSEARARSVIAHIESSHPNLRGKMMARGQGERTPLDERCRHVASYDEPGADATCLASNRRVEISLAD
jgi:outer membrane protein OmpA-like peptidoglycan-associated protein